MESKIAVVTGASAGIGAAIAEELTKSGITVIGLARRMEKLEEVKRQCKANMFHPRMCDVSNEESVMSSFRWIEEKFKGVDILINNAAVANAVSLIDGDSSKWREMIQINLEGVNLCTKEALKTMRKRGDNGYIIHINSVAGHIIPSFPTMPLGIYTATKHAVIALTEALRVELMTANSKIKVSTISPGAVHTDMLSGLVKGETIIANPTEVVNPEDMILSPKDVAEVVTFIITRRNIVQIQDIMIQPLGTKYA